jgi:hypothetical protein
MRRIVVGILTALVMTWGAASAVATTSDSRPTSSAGVVEATCAIAGYLDFSPAITTTPQAIDITLSDARVQYGGTCPLLTRHKPIAPLEGTLHATSLHCRDDHSNVLVTDAPATGILTIKWPNATVSKWRVGFTVSNKIGNHNRFHETFVFSGKVRSGTYAGDHTLAHTDHILPSGSGCGPDDNPITQTSFFDYANDGQEKLLTFTTP